MRRRELTALIALGLAATLPSAPASAATIGPDTFEGATTLGWFVPDAGHPSPPTVIPTGGPGGAGDGYLQLTANASLPGPGSRLSVLNESQWAADYLALGITGIAMDVNNFGPDDLALRLLLVNFPDVPGPPIAIAWTVAPVLVPAGSDWTSVLFDLSVGNLFSPFGGVLTALGDVDELRIFHNPVPAFGGPGIGAPAVTAILGIDNIVSVPEPASALLLMTGVASLASRRIRRRHGLPPRM